MELYNDTLLISSIINDLSDILKECKLYKESDMDISNETLTKLLELTTKFTIVNNYFLENPKWFKIQNNLLKKYKGLMALLNCNLIDINKQLIKNDNNQLIKYLDDKYIYCELLSRVALLLI